MSRRVVLVAAIAAILWLGSRGQAGACGGGYPEALFWYPDRPAEPLDRYLAGHLGIVDPAYDRTYLYLAWRHLGGRGLDAASREAVAAYWKTARPVVEPYERPSWELWGQARRRVTGVPQVNQPYPDRSTTMVVGGVERWMHYPNCLDDAFRSAARTLGDRIATFGADSDIVRGWVVAQDIVFSNCQQGENIPAPLIDCPIPPAGADRAYQIAAAHFYAGHFGEAEQHFRAIAADATSPWRTMAAYLVARALVRQGTVAEPEIPERLEAAAAHLRTVIADPALAEVHHPAQRLLDHIGLELDPAARQRELAAALNAPVLPPSVGETLFDYLWLLRRRCREWGRSHPGEHPEMEEMGAWIMGHQAAERWRRERSLPWLVAAVANASPIQSDLGELLAAAEQVPPDSPAYLTLAYHRSRIAIGQKRFDDARRDLDHLLAERDGSLALGDRNRLLALRAPLAIDLTEFLRLAQKVPVEIGDGYDGGSGLETPPGDPLLERFRGRPLLDDYAAHVLNRDFTPGMLLEVVQRDDLAPGLRTPLAEAAWVRALLAGEWDVAGPLGSQVARLDAPLASDVEALRTPDPEARQFAFAVTLLRWPGLQPMIGSGIDGPWGAWQCVVPASTVAREDPDPALSFITAEERAAAAATHERIRALQPGQLWLGRTVLAWAEAHPDDPRLPEALHRVVRHSREGCTGDGSAMVQTAFRLLHRRYPRSPWTAKTRYWHR